MSPTDHSALVRMVVEGGIALLVSLLTYNVVAIKEDVERALDNGHRANITIEGIRFQTAAHAQAIERIEAIQRRNSEAIVRLEARQK